MAKAKTETPSSKDRGQLSIQVDLCADKLPMLMLETRRKANEAMRNGDLDTADRLDEQSSDLALAFQTVLRHQIKQIDDSQEMRSAIAGFTKINKDIDDIIEQTKQAAAFLKTLSKIVTGLNGLIGKVLN